MIYLVIALFGVICALSYWCMRLAQGLQDRSDGNG